MQIVPGKQSAWNALGEGVGQGVERGAEYAINKGRLQSAFDEISNNPDFENMSYIQQLGKLAPILLNQPGGAQLLGEIAPTLAQKGQNNAITQAINARRAQRGGGGSGGNNSNQPDPNAPVNQTPVAGMQDTRENFSPVARGEDYYRDPTIPNSPYNTFPERTAGPTSTPIMSADELEDYTLGLMQNSTQYGGKPMDYGTAMGIAQTENNNRILNNQQIEADKQRQELAQEKLSEGMLARADNAGLIQDESDKNVLLKFAGNAKKGANEEERWDYVRGQMERYETAKQAIKRQHGPGLWDTIYSKATGNFQPLDTIKKNLQEPLKFFKEHGLFTQARNLLRDDVGMGVEDTEDTLFPMSPEQKREIDRFPKNSHYSRPKDVPKDEVIFPGEEAKLPEKEFRKFKEEIGAFLKENPKANLITLRGHLNRGKNYSWQDINEAIRQLREEKRFRPDSVQESNMNIIKNAPLPGMMQIFNYRMSGSL